MDSTEGAAIKDKLDQLLAAQHAMNLMLENMKGKQELFATVLQHQAERHSAARTELLDKHGELRTEVEALNTRINDADRWKNWQLGFAAAIGMIGGYVLDFLFGRAT